ncbi:MAG: response regulator, partial [Betaproteobacteria bacterium]|nr:response regulator [Betaproteobacteria bacterium]
FDQQVLLAEDSITTRTQEARILESAGYEVVTAADGLEAYGKLATRAFDAVVTDISMPNMDGLALAQKIRGEPKYAELPIILVTALASDEDKRRGLDAGANAYITKPEFDQQVLLDCLERLI